MPTKKATLISLSLLLVTLFIPTQLLAQGRPATLPNPHANQASNSAQGNVQSCLARQSAIKTRSQNLVRTANNLMDKFDQISSRTQDFYANKVIPTGQSVSNYNELLNNVATTSAVVVTDLDKASSEADSFSCDNQDPKTQIKTFNTNMRQVIKDLKIYKTSVRNLIVAVHGSIDQESSHSATESAKNNHGGKP